MSNSYTYFSLQHSVDFTQWLFQWNNRRISHYTETHKTSYNKITIKQVKALCQKILVSFLKHIYINIYIYTPQVTNSQYTLLYVFYSNTSNECSAWSWVYLLCRCNKVYISAQYDCDCEKRHLRKWKYIEYTEYSISLFS